MSQFAPVGVSGPVLGGACLGAESYVVTRPNSLCLGQMNESGIVELRKRAGAAEFTCPAVLCNDGEHTLLVAAEAGKVMLVVPADADTLDDAAVHGLPHDAEAMHVLSQHQAIVAMSAHGGASIVSLQGRSLKQIAPASKSARLMWSRAVELRGEEQDTVLLCSVVSKGGSAKRAPTYTLHVQTMSWQPGQGKPAIRLGQHSQTTLAPPAQLQDTATLASVALNKHALCVMTVWQGEASDAGTRPAAMAAWRWPVAPGWYNQAPACAWSAALPDMGGSVATYALEPRTTLLAWAAPGEVHVQAWHAEVGAPCGAVHRVPGAKGSRLRVTATDGGAHLLVSTEDDAWVGSLPDTAATISSVAAAAAAAATSGSSASRALVHSASDTAGPGASGAKFKPDGVLPPLGLLTNAALGEGTAIAAGRKRRRGKGHASASGTLLDLQRGATVAWDASAAERWVTAAGVFNESDQDVLALIRAAQEACDCAALTRAAREASVCVGPCGHHIPSLHVVDAIVAAISHILLSGTAVERQLDDLVARLASRGVLSGARHSELLHAAVRVGCFPVLQAWLLHVPDASEAQRVAILRWALYADADTAQAFHAWAWHGWLNDSGVAARARSVAGQAALPQAAWAVGSGVNAHLELVQHVLSCLAAAPCNSDALGSAIRTLALAEVESIVATMTWLVKRGAAPWQQLLAPSQVADPVFPGVLHGQVVAAVPQDDSYCRTLACVSGRITGVPAADKLPVDAALFTVDSLDGPAAKAALLKAALLTGRDPEGAAAAAAALALPGFIGAPQTRVRKPDAIARQKAQLAAVSSQAAEGAEPQHVATHQLAAGATPRTPIPKLTHVVELALVVVGAHLPALLAAALRNASAKAVLAGLRAAVSAAGNGSSDLVPLLGPVTHMLRHAPLPAAPAPAFMETTLHFEL